LLKANIDHYSRVHAGAVKWRIVAEYIVDRLAAEGLECDDRDCLGQDPHAHE